MAAENPAPHPSSGAAAAAPAAAKPSFIDEISSLLRELPGLVSDRVELLTLELQRAGQSLAQIAAMVIVAAILGATAWVALWGLAVAVLVALEVDLWVAMLCVLALNGVGVVLALLRVRKLVPLLGLPATRRHLTLRPVADAVLHPRAATAAPSQSKVPAHEQPAAH